MSKQNYLFRYLTILKVLRGCPKEYQEIYNAVMRDAEFRGEQISYSLRTFQRDKKDIKRFFNINVMCDNHSCYYIESEDSSFSEMNNRLLESFDMIQEMKVNREYSQYLKTESHCIIGLEYVSDILFATKHCHPIRLRYQSYTDESPKDRIIQPSGIKEFKHRWYLIGFDEAKKEMRTFGLDRIRGLEVLKDLNFKREEVHKLEIYYANQFGIVHQKDIEPETIQLRVDALYGKYIESCPLHESQQIIEKTDSHFIIELYLSPTYDFVQELLTMYDRMSVLKPQHLKDEIMQIHQSCLQQ